MKKILWLGASLFLFCLAAPGCSTDNGPVACGVTACNVFQMCDATIPTAPRCVCRPGYAGATCTSCASGYTMGIDGSCVQLPVDCSRGSAACNRHGVCNQVGGPGSDYCTCEAAYLAPSCTMCAPGYQDNDKDGQCQAGCLLMANMICAPPLTCNDDSGNAMCGCAPGSGLRSPGCTTCMPGLTFQSNGTCIMCGEGASGDLCATCAPGFMKAAPPTTGCVRCGPNTTGENCAECVSGFARNPGNGQCERACSSNTQCGNNGFCDMALPVPACACRPGFAGANCSECAAGYTRDNVGQCVMLVIPSGTTLLGVGTVLGAQSILAINPTAGTATAIRPLPAGISALAADVTTKTLFAINAQGVNRLDLKSGTMVPIATIQNLGGLTFGMASLFTIPQANPYLLKRVSPVNGAIADIGSGTNLAGIQSLAYEGLTNTIIAARWTGLSPELHRINPGTGLATQIGAVIQDPMALRPSNSQIGMAVDPVSGQLYLATAVGRKPADILADHCRTIAAGLGLAGYEAAPINAKTPQQGVGAGNVEVLENTAGSSGKQIVAYASNANDVGTPATIRIGTGNPASFICIMTNDESINLFIPQNAQFAAIVFTGDRPRLTLEIEGVREVVSPLIHVYARSNTFVQAVDQFQIAKVYTTSEWTVERRLPYFQSLWDTDSMAPVQLAQVGIADQKIAKVQTFPNITLLPILTPWLP